MMVLAIIPFINFGIFFNYRKNLKFLNPPNLKIRRIYYLLIFNLIFDSLTFSIYKSINLELILQIFCI